MVKNKRKEQVPRVLTKEEEAFECVRGNIHPYVVNNFINKKPENCKGIVTMVIARDDKNNKATYMFEYLTFDNKPLFLSCDNIPIKW